jgi:hypothetical protein
VKVRYHTDARADLLDAAECHFTYPMATAR